MNLISFYKPVQSIQLYFPSVINRAPQISPLVSHYSHRGPAWPFRQYPLFSLPSQFKRLFLHAMIVSVSFDILQNPSFN